MAQSLPNCGNGTASWHVAMDYLQNRMTFKNLPILKKKLNNLKKSPFRSDSCYYLSSTSSEVRLGDLDLPEKVLEIPGDASF
jgi:hypothetical protein